MLYDVTCFGGVGHYVSLDFLELSCGSHCFWLVFDVCEIEEIYSCHLEVKILLDEVEYLS